MRQLLVGLSAVALLAACSGGDSGTDPVTNPGITLSASASSGTVARGASGTTSLTLTRVDGFAGSVALSAEGVPSGVTVSFAPQSLTGTTLSSVATITVGTTAAPGASTITFKASGTGVTDKTVSYALTVPSPAITVTAGTAPISAIQGSSANVPITITRTNGATGAVTLAVEGLPTGVTGAFTPSPIPSAENTSTLNLIVGASAAAGTSTVTVRASGTGLTDQTATFQLVITSSTVPSYTITSTPASLAVVAGQQGTTLLNITKAGGFTGNVTLSLEGAPTGVTGSFAPNPATGSSSTLTLNTTAATVAGAYNVTVRGTAAGLTDRTISIALTVNPAAGVSLILAPTSLSIAQGANAQAALTLTRVGGFAGDVNLTATGAPAGMTVAFAPAAVSGTSSTVTVTVGAAVAAGTYPVTITGTGTGGITASIPLSVTVTAVGGFTLAATSATAAQGGTGNSTVTITRTGSFTGPVNLLVSGLPANVTAAFNPTPATGATSTLTFTAAAGATVGASTITVNGTGTGAANQSTTLTLNVTAIGGGAAVAWRFCDANRVPLWLAFRNGNSGPWTQVTAGGDNTFNFAFSGAIGSVAYVQNNTNGGTEGTVFMNTVSELPLIAAQECTSNAGTKVVNGTVTNVGAMQSATAYLGGSSATAGFGATALTFNTVRSGVTDLLAIRSNFNAGTSSFTPDRGILRRNVNYGPGSTAPVLDFTGAESFPVASASITVANAGADQLTTLATLVTANGTAGTNVSGVFTGTPVTVYGVPSSLTQAGDLHLLFAIATSGTTSFRGIYQYNKDLANRTLTLGGALNLPTVTVAATTPYARLRVRGTWQAEYGDAAGTTMTQSTGTPRSWTLTASRGFFGLASTEFDLELPDFSAVSGFQNIWGLATGVSTQVNTTAYNAVSGTYGTVPTEGLSFRTASRVQTITP